MTGQFRKKSLFFLDTRDHQEHDTKNRLSIPGPSPEKRMAEIHELKKTDPSPSFNSLSKITDNSKFIF